MTKDEALKLALEVMHNQGDVGVDEWIAAKAAIKQALAQPNRGSVGVQEAQRQWVGLTDEDRQAAFESMPDMLDGFLKTWGWLHFSKAIEAKLKEKNT